MSFIIGMTMKNQETIINDMKMKIRINNNKGEYK